MDCCAQTTCNLGYSGNIYYQHFIIDGPLGDPGPDMVHTDTFFRSSFYCGAIFDLGTHFYLETGLDLGIRFISDVYGDAVSFLTAINGALLFFAKDARSGFYFGPGLYVQLNDVEHGPDRMLLAGFVYGYSFAEKNGKRSLYVETKFFERSEHPAYYGFAKYYQVKLGWRLYSGTHP
ncbi:MAG: hypothetical protein R2794_05005 [Chitinophagales bacterium]